MAYLEAQTFKSGADIITAARAVNARLWKEADTLGKIELINSVWHIQISARQIAGALSNSRQKVTRNAVIGMYTRYGKELAAHPLNMINGAARAAQHNRRGKPRKGCTKPIQIKDHLSRAKTIKPPLPISYVYLDAPVSRELRFGELSRFECQWETANAMRAEDYRFCGHAIERGAWCAYHFRKARVAA